MASTLINVPAKARRGEVITLKTLISHVMESGFRRSQLGVAIPRDIITSFVCTYNGEEIFKAALYQAIAANPFVTFTTIATESGTIAFVAGRQRIFSDRVGQHHRRMSASLKRTQWLAPAAVLLGLAAAAVISVRAEISLSERRSGYADLATGSKLMGRRHHQSRHAWVLDRGSVLERQDRHEPRLRRLPQ